MSGDFILRRDQRVELEDCRFLRILRRFDRRRIGHDAHHAFSRFFFVAEDVDVVAVALAHLLAIEAGNGFGCGLNSRLGQFENLPIGFVHFHREIARHFDVLFLVFADWHDVAVVNQNVRRHEHGITEQSNVGAHAAREFVLVRVRAFEQVPSALPLTSIQASSVTCGTSDWRKSVARSGIETARQKIECDAAAVCAQHFRVAQTRQCVVIGDEIKCLALGLQGDGRPHHAEIIADVQGAAGLDAG